MYEGLPGCLYFSSDIDRIRYKRMSTNICWVFGRPMKTGMMLLRGVSEFRSLICSFFPNFVDDIRYNPVQRL